MKRSEFLKKFNYNLFSFYKEILCNYGRGSTPIWIEYQKYLEKALKLEGIMLPHETYGGFIFRNEDEKFENDPHKYLYHKYALNFLLTFLC